MSWHCCLAQVSLKGLVNFPRITNAPRMTKKCYCETCSKCKLMRKPFTQNTISHAAEPLPLVHSDICSPLDTAIRGGQYMLHFIYDTTRHTDEYILKYNSDALQKFKEWKAVGGKVSCKQVKRFRTDGGGDYSSKKSREYLKSEMILKETTTPYTLQTNRVIEQTNCTIMQSAPCMLDDARHSWKYWIIAVSVEVYLKNHILIQLAVSKTPYEA